MRSECKRNCSRSQQVSLDPCQGPGTESQERSLWSFSSQGWGLSSVRVRGSVFGLSYESVWVRVKDESLGLEFNLRSRFKTNLWLVLGQKLFCRLWLGWGQFIVKAKC